MTRPANFCFLGLVATSVALWWHPLLSTIRLALVSEAHTHILMIVPLSSALAFMQRKCRTPDAQSHRIVGYFLLTGALIVGAIAQWGHLNWPDDASLSLSIFALVTLWIGSLIACYGTSTLRAYLFPMLFLYWLVPIPDMGLDRIISSLQILSAYAARLFLIVGGVPVTQDGTFLSMPAFDVDVAPQCSSIRSSLMLMITTMFLAQVSLRSWWGKACLIVVAVPMAAVKNGLRIFTLVQIGTRLDPAIFDSDLHRRGGVVFFAISVVLTILLLLFLRRVEHSMRCQPEVAARIA